MLKSYMESDCVKNFLADVTEQIQYKQAREHIETELKGHIEDRTLEMIEEGIPKEKAIEVAVKRMGDAAVIGVEMNRAYSLQRSMVLYILIGISLFSGILANFAYGYILHYNSYFIWGIIVLIGMVLVGYRFFITKISLVYLLYGGLLALLLYKGIGTRLDWYRFDLSFFRSFGLQFNMNYLILPVFAITLYKVKNKNLIKIISSFFIILLPYVLQNSTIYYRFSILGCLIFILSTMVVFYILVLRGFFSIDKRKIGLAGTIFFVFLFMVFVSVFGKKYETTLEGQDSNVLQREITLMIDPEVQATNIWQDGYNGVLIKELLKRAKLFGEVELSKQQLMAYGTGEWLLPEDKAELDLRYLHYDESSVTLEKILPQHYHNNYRVAYTIIKYGWFAGLSFIGLLLAIVIQLFVITYRIKNKLGFILSLTSTVVFMFQIIFYLLGNFGYQFGMFCNLPLISEGLMSITVNMILLGLIIAAYRYDKVIEFNLIKKPKKIA